MESLLQDLRFGVRMLLKNPGFTLIAVLALALGTGVNTSIFSLLDAALLRSLPVRQPEQLVKLQRLRQDGKINAIFSYPAFRDYHEQNQVCSGLFAYYTTPLSLSGGRGVAERIYGTLASGDYFPVLGVQAALGRMFGSADDQTPGGRPVTVISYGLWRRRFAGSRDVIGKTITLNNYEFTVIGVAPPNFTGLVRGFSSDLWLPLAMSQQAIPDDPPDTFANRSLIWLQVMGRLKPGVTPMQATASLETLGNQIDQANGRPGQEKLMIAPGEKGATWMVSEFALPLKLLMTVVGIVLLIACANVANLLLARAGVRRKEIAVRLALGANRRRLVRQLLTESVMLALLGGAAGLVVAVWSNDFWRLLKPADDYFPLSIEGRLDWRALGFTLLVSLLTGLVFGLAPALQSSKFDLIPTLKDEAYAFRGERRFSLRNLLVIAQVALSLALLIGAGLFVRSLGKLQSLDVGFRPERMLVVSLDPSLHGYDQAKGRELYRTLLERVRSLPGVRMATLAATVSPNPGGSRIIDAVEIEGRAGSIESVAADENRVGPDYFTTMNIRLLRGRDFTAQDREGGPPIAVINETMARRLFPGEDPIGRRFRFGDADPFIEVVGVVGDGKYRSLREEATLCLYQPFLMNYRHAMNLLVRTEGEPQSIVPAVRNIVAALDPRLPVFNVRTLDEQVRAATAQERAVATLTSLFGALALLLAAIGIYGMMAYTITQRTREIGLRMALGAQRADVLRLVVRQGMLLVLIGVAIGMAASFALMRLLDSLLFGVSATDPLTFAGSSLLLVVAAMMACWIPALCATKVDPLTALRHE
jgi:putative ABC transport system permease protein